MYETWNHQYTPESNRYSAESKVPGESVSKQIFIHVFLDTHGIINFDYLEEGKPINCQYYKVLLMGLKEEIAKKWLQMKTRKILFHQDIPP